MSIYRTMNRTRAEAVRSAGAVVFLAVLVCLMAVCPSACEGQTTTPWDTIGTGIWYSPAGVSVGIGTSSPLGGFNVANGYLYQTTNANGSGVSPSFIYGGLAIGWNRIAGTGETDLITNRGGGTGGFQFTDFNNSTYTNLMTIQSSGNVGIGTIAPFAKLEVNSSNGTAPVLNIYSSPTNYTSQMPVGVLALGTNGGGNNIPAANITGISENNADSSQGALSFSTRRASTIMEAMRITSGGNVGINTTNPVHPLQVNGTIGATEVIVSSTGADYVFAPDYHLRALADVSAYIRQNHHLPEIPSAAEVQEKGVSLGDMQAKLLAKVEELTLHMIQEYEANARLAQENQQLQARIARIEALAAGTAPAQP